MLRLALTKRTLGELCLILALFIFIFLYFTKPTALSFNLNYVPKYYFLSLQPNETKCINENLIVLKHPMLSPEENPIIYGNKTALKTFFTEKEICFNNTGNDTLEIFVATRQWADLFSNCKVWQAWDIGNQTIYQCVQGKEDNQTAWINCESSCSEYFQREEKYYCTKACYQAWVEKFLPKSLNTSKLK